MTITKGALGLMMAALILPLGCGGTKKDNSGEQPRVTLKEKYQPGTYRATFDIAGEVEMEAEGEKQTLPVGMFVDMRMDVSEPDETGTSRITLSFNRARMKSGPIDLDTDAIPSGPTAEAHAQFKKLLGLKLLLTHNPVAGTTSFKGFDKESRRRMARDPQFAQMAEQFSKGASIEELLSANKMLPVHAVGAGAVWHPKFKQPLANFGHVDVEAECKLKELKDTPAGKVAVIEFTGKVGDPSKAKGQMGPMSMEFIDIDVEQEGTLEFNVDNGMVKSMKMRQKGTMEFKMTGPRGQEATAKSKLDMTASVTVTPM